MGRHEYEASSPSIYQTISVMAFTFDGIVYAYMQDPRVPREGHLQDAMREIFAAVSLPPAMGVAGPLDEPVRPQPQPQSEPVRTGPTSHADGARGSKGPLIMPLTLSTQPVRIDCVHNTATAGCLHKAHSDGHGGSSSALTGGGYGCLIRPSCWTRRQESPPGSHLPPPPLYRPRPRQCS